MIKLNGLIDEELTSSISSKLSVMDSVDEDAPTPGIFPVVPEINLNPGEILSLLATSIAQLGPQSRALELRFQKQELALKKFEHRLLALEGKVDGLHGVATEAVEKLNFQSRELSKQGGTGVNAAQLGAMLEQAISSFGGSLLASLEDALVTAEEVRAMRRDVQEAIGQIVTQVNGNVPHG